MWSMLLMCAGLAVPLVLARYWAMSRRQRHIDRLRSQDPHLATQIEQVAYSLNPAGLSMRDRSGKSRRRNHF
jgi:hypothetical protein